MANGGTTSTVAVGSAIIIAAVAFFAGFVAMNVWWVKSQAASTATSTTVQACEELVPASRTVEMTKEATTAEQRVREVNAHYRHLNRQLEQVRKNYVKFNKEATCPPLKIRTGTLNQHLKQLEDEIGKIRVKAKLPPADPRCPGFVK